MTKALIQQKQGRAFGTSAFSALLGFEDMGLDIVPFDPEELAGISREASDIVVGGVGIVRSTLRALGREVPEICYPKELEPFLGRRVWRSTINTVSTCADDWPVFVKPVQGKLFTGRLVTSAKDLIGCGMCGEDAEVHCSDPVSLVAEWRCFVMRGQILDVRPYRGDWRVSFDPSIIESAVYCLLKRAGWVWHGLWRDRGWSHLARRGQRRVLTGFVRSRVPCLRATTLRSLGGACRRG